ncbi:hypothetical protein HanXRQr2_Chr15g0721921 [Helianthus annuus]|uniref:Uncharacterized protein n=1 Tax=Helianthus annuus TaxID=4232 RepID=A0A9K3E4V5_HELAN|nr:hypothetical protein HanXRQr2_Chr15g0721921 [Helianthus annuus]
MSVKMTLLFEKPPAKGSCTPLSHPGIRRTLTRKLTESHLRGGVLRLAQRSAVIRALIRLAVKIDRGLEPRRVIWTFSYARVRRQIEATPLRQFLQLVLIHPFTQ